MSYWSFYFLAKVALHYGGYLELHWIPNLLLALALLLPRPSGRGLRLLRNAAAVVAAVALLYYDSYLPSLERLLALRHGLAAFSWDYMAELLGRLWNGQAVLAFVVLLAVYGLLAQRIRFATFALGGILSVPLAAALAPQPGGAAAVAAPAATPVGAPAQAATLEPDAQLQAFYAHERQRRLDWSALGATPAFDIVVLHVCSLSWDDLDVVGMRDHPLLQRFDAVFTQFNTAASYSGPAMLRVLRGNCGQEGHDALYQGTDPACYVFPSLEQLGYETQAVLNHDGHFDDFAKMLQNQGGLAGRVAPLEGMPVHMHSFDGSPIYNDLALLERWSRARGEGTSGKPAALYYNTISLHDGNRVPGLTSRSSQETFKPRLSKLFADFDQFITGLERAGRPVVVLLVPEHGAALRGDKLQISGMREIPSPRITIVPAAMKIVGLPAGAGGSGPVLVDQPVSYFGLNALLGDLLRDSPFAPGARPLVQRLTQLESTPLVAENGEMVVLRDAAGQYRMRTDKGSWVSYNP